MCKEIEHLNLSCRGCPHRDGYICDQEYYEAWLKENSLTAGIKKLFWRILSQKGGKKMNTRRWMMVFITMVIIAIAIVTVVSLGNGEY